MIENLLIGGLAGVISRSATAPLELYKISKTKFLSKRVKYSECSKKRRIAPSLER